VFFGYISKPKWFVLIIYTLCNLALVIGVSHDLGSLRSLGDSLDRFRDKKTKSSFHNQAYQSYFDGSYITALSYAQQYHDHILNEDEGCELLISIYATVKKYAAIENTARHCLSQRKAVALAAEALAMALASVGRSWQAINDINDIKANTPFQNDPRIMAALAQLYVYVDSPIKAREYLLFAIKEGNPWGPWLNRVFTSKVFYTHKPFLQDVVQLLLEKNVVIFDAESQLLEHLKHLGMDKDQRLLANRLARHHPQ